MIFLKAFIVGGLICMFAQFLMDFFKLLPVYITSILVMLGSVFTIGGLYEKLIEFSGCGATTPISSFGYLLTKSAYDGAMENGYIGIFTSMFDTTSLGISVAIIFSFLMALIFKPRS